MGPLVAFQPLGVLRPQHERNSMRTRLAAISGITISCVLCVALRVHSQGTWDEKAPLVPVRTNLRAEALDGLVYAIGGSNGGCPGTTPIVTQAYDPLANTWTERAALPQPPGHAGHRTAFATAVVNGQIYAFGGGNCLTFFSDAQVYNPTTNAWSVLEPMPTTRRLGSLYVDNSGKLVVVGTNK